MDTNGADGRRGRVGVDAVDATATWEQIRIVMVSQSHGSARREFSPILASFLPLPPYASCFTFSSVKHSGLVLI